jgi:hypothetical protein
VRVGIRPPASQRKFGRAQHRRFASARPIELPWRPIVEPSQAISRLSLASSLTRVFLAKNCDGFAFVVL